MRKSVDVVIPMQQNSDYKLLYPQSIDWDKFVEEPPFAPFDGDVLDYLNELSVSILKDKESRLYSDVVTFAFFCRRGNLLKKKSQFCGSESLRLGRGTLFHIAPSNVPINFAYSLVSGLVSGNCNVVRVSSKSFPQVDILIRHIHQLGEIKKFANIAHRIALVRYDRDSCATSFFSSFASVRIIWGGDATIANVRKNELRPRSFDVCFADRYSIALLNPQSILHASDSEMDTLAENFYNDTYLFDQNACSSPHLLFWLCKECASTELEKAKNKFWNSIYSFVSQKYELQAVLCVDKLTNFYRQSICLNIEKEEMPDNLIVRTKLKDLSPNIDMFRCAGGYFTEMDVSEMDNIASVLTSKYQTMVYYGITKADLESFVVRNHLFGLDRIVPIGKSSDFDFIWDGYDLIKTLSRIITVI